jgi:hypothetical protein
VPGIKLLATPLKEAKILRGSLSKIHISGKGKRGVGARTLSEGHSTKQVFAAIPTQTQSSLERAILNQSST